MIFYRSRQNWLPRNHFLGTQKAGSFHMQLHTMSLLPKPALLPPPTPQENGSKKYFKSQAETWKISWLSVWIYVCLSVSLVGFDNIAQVLSSYLNGLQKG